MPKPVNASPIIVWFRQDLRLQDNAALSAAVSRGGPVLPVFIYDEAGEGDWPPGAASKWWLHRSLVALGASLRDRGSRLILVRGESSKALADLAVATAATAVYWNRRYEPSALEIERTVAAKLGSAGVETRSFNSTLLFEPHTIKNRQGKPFQVFTPFWRHCLAREVAPPIALRKGPVTAPVSWPVSCDVRELGLLPTIRWDGGLETTWTPGEFEAAKRLKAFVASSLKHYDDERNTPDEEGTSRLSPHLHFGEIGPRQIWSAVKSLSKDSGVFPPHRGAQVFLTEIGWREFANHLLFHYPRTPASPLREVFERFPWAKDAGGKRLRAWQRGMTGYPIVDAGMRELWRTGWMHNRVRMIVASFLVKHLRLPWQRGAEWFWHTLVDADLANNTLGWQWSAGCGADATPYFRIFAPVAQGKRFDAAGEYVRRWVPELAALPDAFIHAPWTAPVDALVKAGVRLGVTYPQPIVDHAAARADALAAFKSLRVES